MIQYPRPKEFLIGKNHQRIVKNQPNESSPWLPLFHVRGDEYAE
jgi:hypothetical protein